MDADHLKSRSIKFAYVAKAMFHKRVSVEASKLPWSLTQGDIAANLNELAAGPRPAELGGKIHDLLTVIGYSRKELVKALELMREIGWCALFVEQMLATVTSLLRFHPEYNFNKLLARTIGLCLNRLVPNESADERRLRMLRDRLQRLLRRQPEKVSGRHMYVKDLFILARVKAQKTGVPLQCGYQQKIMKRHGRFFCESTFVSAEAV